MESSVEKDENLLAEQDPKGPMMVWPRTPDTKADAEMDRLIKESKAKEQASLESHYTNQK